MRISGFSMVKNADSLYYPIKAAIESILPLVDEFVLALGDCKPGDRTQELIDEIKSDKLKVIHTVWDLEQYPRGMENAHQTDIAKAACTGDWLFYLQADEVVHERYLPVIKARCLELLHDEEIEGLLFHYKHFWGDYKHYHISHGWYPNEIRIVRNRPEIHSWESAQSFRRIPQFDGINYRQQEGTFKLKVARVDAYIYHYGWVRPPHYMQNKKKALDTIHKGQAKVQEMYEQAKADFDYGPLGRLGKYEDTHPAVMQEWLDRFNWGEKLNYGSSIQNNTRALHKHERFKYRLLTFLEQNLLGGRQIGGFKNYILLKR